MTMDPSAQPGAFAGRQPISTEEVLRLRRQMWSDGSISPDEAAELFALNDRTEPSAEWTDFFVEALCDYLIARGQPRGYVTDADGDWLIHQVSRDGRLDSHAELELLVKLFERADCVPDALKHFALEQVERTVLTGTGPTRRGGDIVPGRIDDAEVALLRRLVFAPAGDGPAKVSRSEAELLFRLKDATLGADNSAEWPRLFVQGVANHLMAHQDYAPPSREDAARMERGYKENVFGVLAKLGEQRASFGEFRAAVGGGEAQRSAAHDEAVASDAEVSRDESAWLRRLEDGDGARDPLEQALVDFLKAEGAGAL